MQGYYDSTNCAVIGKLYDTYMQKICSDLLDQTKSLYYLLYYVEGALFILFLFSLALVGMIRPEDED